MDNFLPQSADTGFLTGIVSVLMPSWRAQDIGPFEYLSGGYSNENYRFAHADEWYVLRVPDRERPFVDREHEAKFYRQRPAVRTAELIALDRSSGFLITRFEDGVLLCDAQPAIDRIADYARQLHAGLPASGRHYDPIALAREYLSEGSPPAWIRQLADRLAWRPSLTIPCHNDLNPWNIIQPESGAWVTLDWEWFGDNDPLFDLVTLHQGLGLDWVSLYELAARYLDGPVDGERLQYCLNAFWLREYAWAHAERFHGNGRPEIEGQIANSAERLREFQSSSSSG